MRNLNLLAGCLLFAGLTAGILPGQAADKRQNKPPKGEPAMYRWEKNRKERPSYTDMVLCYGGSHHRNPFLWEKERLIPYVSYVNPNGKEEWLFDSFLFLESQDVNRPDKGAYSFMTGVLRGTGVSAGKEQWQELIDYYFQKGNCVDALEEAVGEASKRMGKPIGKRKVILMMPDPIIYYRYDITTESTTYWGTLDGRTLDFSKGEDRLAACKWYIDQIRHRFDQGNFRHVELAGFYLISEEIVTPGDGWCHELKRSEETVPAVAQYLHSINSSFCWIPYNRAAGYTKWKELGVDYAYMQPNYYWDNKGIRPLSRYFEDILSQDLGMEFEFEESLLEGAGHCEIYRQRFIEYMEGAVEHGIYGTRPLSYYQGNNGLYKLAHSTHPKDRELYHRFCRFVIDNPLRNKQQQTE